VRKAALEALDDEDKKVITEVIKLLNDRKDEVRLAAIKKLRQFCDKKAIPALKQALKDENREIRDEARYALSLIVGGKGCASTDDLD
jgi:HEAT repeat protein